MRALGGPWSTYVGERELARYTTPDDAYSRSCEESRLAPYLALVVDGLRGPLHTGALPPTVRVLAYFERGVEVDEPTAQPPQPEPDVMPCWDQTNYGVVNAVKWPPNK